MPQDKIIIRFQPKGDKDLIKAIQSLAVAQSRLEKNTKAVRQELKKLGARGKLATQYLRNVKDSSIGAASAFSVMRSKLLLASFAFTIASQVVGRFVKAASSAEETMNRANVVFGNNADEVKTWAEDYGNAVGRATSSLVGFAAKLQDTFVPMGIARSDAAQLSVELTKLALDVASFQEKADADVLNAFQSALVGNHETVKAYGIMITQASLQQEALSSGIITTNRELSELEKVQARVNLLYKGSKDAQGDLLRTQKDFANQQKALANEFKELSEAIGREMLPVMTEALKIVRVFMKILDPSRIIAYTIAMTALWGVTKLQAYWAGIAALNMAKFNKAMRKNLITLVALIASAEIINWFFGLSSAGEEATESVKDFNIELETLEMKLEGAGLGEFASILKGAGHSVSSITSAIIKLDDAMAVWRETTGGFSAVFAKTYQEVEENLENVFISTGSVSDAFSNLNSDTEKLDKSGINLTRTWENQTDVTKELTDFYGKKNVTAGHAVEIAKETNALDGQQLSILEQGNMMLAVRVQLEQKLAAAKADLLLKTATLIPGLNNEIELQKLALANEETGVITRGLKLEQDQVIKKLQQEGMDLTVIEEGQTETLEQRIKKLVETRYDNSQALKQQNANMTAAKSQIQSLNGAMANFLATTSKGQITWTSFGEVVKKQILSMVATFLANLATFKMMSMIFPKASLVAPSLMGVTGGTMWSGITDFFSGLFHQGGPVQGYAVGGMVPSMGIQTYQGGGSVDNVPAVLQEGEYVMRRSAVDSIGIENLNRMNRTGLAGGGGVNITFSGNVVSDDFIEDVAIPKIKDAIRRGADIGIS